MSAQASTQLASGVPFVSEADLTAALESAAVPDELATEIVQEYNDASLAALRASMAAVALFAIVALFLSERIPTKAVGAELIRADQSQLQGVILMKNKWYLSVLVCGLLALAACAPAATPVRPRPRLP